LIRNTLYVVCDQPMNFLAFVFPCQTVDSDLEALVQGAATVLPAGQGIGALVTSLLRELDAHSGDIRPAAVDRLATPVRDLLATLSADLQGAEPSIDGADGATQRALVEQVKAYIEAHLAEPHLSSTTVAAAHYISVRHLQKLFETQGLTVSGWIRKRRLEHARRDLSDPAQRSVSITVIADRWRFADSAHFSRAFKAAYGLSPRDYRQGKLDAPAG
jgi:AraC-like DNA-binding protein